MCVLTVIVNAKRAATVDRSPFSCLATRACQSSKATLISNRQIVSGFYLASWEAPIDFRALKIQPIPSLSYNLSLANVGRL